MIYFVDPAKGSDGFSGMSEAMAWKHAPGDARAVGALGVLAP